MPFHLPGGHRRAILSVAGVAAVVVVTVAALFPSRAGDGGAPVPEGVKVRARHARETMARAERALREARQAAGLVPEAGLGDDPSGLIGSEVTPLTTTLGNLEAKRLAVSPAWAAALATRVWQAGARPGDVVAAGFSGSFPGLNLAMVTACAALDVRLVAISSVTASSFGANQPGFTWPEIEDRLADAAIIDWVSAAVSAGGANDRADDLEPDGRALARTIAERIARKRAVPVMTPADFAHGVEARLEMYGSRASAARGRIVLYANVGGNEISLGRSMRVLSLGNGLRPGVPFDFSPSRGVLARFAERGVPVLNLLDARGLALRWGLL